MGLPDAREATSPQTELLRKNAFALTVAPLMPEAFPALLRSDLRFPPQSQRGGRRHCACSSRLERRARTACHAFACGE